MEMRTAVDLDICKRWSPLGTALIGTNKSSYGKFGAVERTRTSTPCGASTSSECVCQFRHDRDDFHRKCNGAGCQIRRWKRRKRAGGLRTPPLQNRVTVFSAARELAAKL